VDIPEPLQKKEQAVTAVVHVRSTKVKQNGNLVCPDLLGSSLLPSSSSSSSTQLHGRFAQELQLLQSTVRYFSPLPVLLASLY
jgi:hypothetical protein